MFEFVQALHSNSRHGNTSAQKISTYRERAMWANKNMKAIQIDKKKHSQTTTTTTLSTKRRELITLRRRTNIGCRAVRNVRNRLAADALYTYLFGLVPCPIMAIKWPRQCSSSEQALMRAHRHSNDCASDLLYILFRISKPGALFCRRRLLRRIHGFFGIIQRITPRARGNMRACARTSPLKDAKNGPCWAKAYNWECREAFRTFTNAFCEDDTFGLWDWMVEWCAELPICIYRRRWIFFFFCWNCRHPITQHAHVAIRFCSVSACPQMKCTATQKEGVFCIVWYDLFLGRCCYSMQPCRPHLYFRLYFFSS